MLIHDFIKASLFLFSRVIIHLTNDKSNITGPQRGILLLMYAIIKPDSLSHCCFDSCLLFKREHRFSRQLMRRWPRSHSKQVDEISVFVRWYRRKEWVHIIPSLNREFHLLTEKMTERGAGQGKDVYRHPQYTGLFGLVFKIPGQCLEAFLLQTVIPHVCKDLR